MIADGHDVENHTYSHAWLDQADAEEFHDELERAEAAIR